VQASQLVLLVLLWLEARGYASVLGSMLNVDTITSMLLCPARFAACLAVDAACCLHLSPCCCRGGKPSIMPEGSLVRRWAKAAALCPFL
jgi:hypothetical protein